jgi:hypothetical protein
VRTQAEIQGAMMQRLAGTESGLAAYWPLGEGTGTTAFDGATGVRKGTVSGAAWDTGATYWALAPGGGTLIQVR